MVKKYIKGLPSSSFNNQIVKKLKTYTSHSQLPRWRYNGTQKKKGGGREKQGCVYEKKEIRWIWINFFLNWKKEIQGHPFP